jgi:hypothetical protein
MRLPYVGASPFDKGDLRLTASAQAISQLCRELKASCAATYDDDVVKRGIGHKNWMP